MLYEVELKQGVSKNGRPWTALAVKFGNYTKYVFLAPREVAYIKKLVEGRKEK